MFLTVGLGELGFGLWNPSGRFGMIYFSDSRVRRVGIWALGPKRGFGMIFFSDSRVR